MMYGPVDNLAESAVSSLYADLQNGVRKVDDWQIRYPTWAADVAGVLRAMVDLHCSGTELQGIFHWQSTEKFTKYEMVCLVAEVSGLDASSVVPISTAPM